MFWRVLEGSGRFRRGSEGFGEFGGGSRDLGLLGSREIGLVRVYGFGRLDFGPCVTRGSWFCVFEFRV